MQRSSWSDGIPVLGQLPPEEAAARLREVGDEATAKRLEAAQEGPTEVLGPGGKRRWPFQDKPWQHTGLALGHLAPTAPGQETLPIRSLDEVPADPTLKQARLKFTLERLRVAEYPGRGTHRILLHFFAQNQLAGRAEPVHFNATYRARGRSSSAAWLSSLRRAACGQ